MLHLIWNKDNNSLSSEDGKELKGVRQRLLECYRLLYFDPIAELEPKDQVNRIAKNLIEYVYALSSFVYQYLPWISRRTYDATLAELTSLEEMMRIMMEENHIHHDVIMKLWQVYSMFFSPSRCPASDLFVGIEKPLPKPQRRGAIIILGMLALAKRSVLTDKVDVMLKVGLGPLGKVRIKS